MIECFCSTLSWPNTFMRGFVSPGYNPLDCSSLFAVGQGMFKKGRAQSACVLLDQFGWCMTQLLRSKQLPMP